MKKVMPIVLLFCFVAVRSGSANAFWGKKVEPVKKEEVKQEMKQETSVQTDIVAKVGERKITAAELDKAAEKDLMPVATQIYKAKKQRLDQMIEDELYSQEAKRQGKSVEDIKKEVSAPTATISDDAIEVYFDSNQARFSGKTLDQAKEEIRRTLISQKAGKSKNQFLSDLKKTYPTEIYLQEPKVELDISGQPVRGPQNAKVTIVEFSDFQCPFCKRFKATVDQLVKEYPNDVKHVYRNLPLAFHSNAMPAARGAICANRQGKFWEFRDVLFENATALEEANLRKYAEQAKLDLTQYDACLKDPAVDKQVDADLAYAQQVGASGTPTSFINGVLFSGARPYEELKRVVDEKLGKN